MPGNRSTQLLAMWKPREHGALYWTVNIATVCNYSVAKTRRCRKNRIPCNLLSTQRLLSHPVGLQLLSDRIKINAGRGPFRRGH